MREMPSKQQILDRGQRAKELLDSPAFQECLAEIESRLVDQWLNSTREDFTVRELAYERLQAIRDIRAQVKLFMDEAALAKR